MKLEIFRDERSDQRAVLLDGELVYNGDEGMEALVRVARHLDWEISQYYLTRPDFESRFG